MKVFYIKKSEFLDEISRDELEKCSDGKKYKSEKKYIEHLCGLYLTKYVAKNFYNISDTTIISHCEKPKFLNSDINFSISHSNDLVLVAFDKNNIGADIEYMADRNFKAILNYYHKDVKDVTKEEFYRFWTELEAKIKLNSDVGSLFCIPLGNEYMMTIVSDECMVSDFEIIKL